MEKGNKLLPTHVVQAFGKLCLCWDSGQVSLIRWGRWRAFGPVCRIGRGSVVVKNGVVRLLGLYNILDRYSRYLRTSTYVQKIDPS
jgi:hypothetical protein